MRHLKYILAVCASSILVGATPPAANFNKTVQSLLRQNCSGCHNEKLASGGLNLAPFMQAESVAAHREGWERILAKVRTGEMPPKGLPRPPADQLHSFIQFINAEFDRADRLVKPDPGPITARRLNRAEYSNTVRDLLGVHFRAEDEFPPDDSGYGFDNIGDVLTVSPALMQRYLVAAERIASRAVGADPLPKAGLFNKRAKIRRKDVSTIEFTDIIDYDADYIVRALITGHRGPEGKPVNLLISVDGKPIKAAAVESMLTKVTKLGGATQRTTEEERVYLTQGPHTFRAEFVDDAIGKALAPNKRLLPGQNIFPESIELAGPFQPKEVAPSRKRLLMCDPESGAACVERILAPVVHRAFRRPVTKEEVAKYVAVHEKAQTAGYNAGQSLQFAIAALLVSPEFLYRVERDPPTDKAVRITDVELASRLSYFLWSSMPDDELLASAEAGKLHLNTVLDAQVKRMLADPKSAAFAENFAGQWLETRSLDAVKPDPKKFPDWGPELKDAMRTETRMFFEAVMRDNRSISDFIDGKYTFLNEALAKHYGIADVTGADFRRVELSTAQRSGVLTQASVLTVSSYPSRTSPVLRGKYVLENMLGAAPPPPPADVPALDEAAVGNKGSLRQMFEQHRSNPVCASCHSRMDVLGFGLENYDGIGKWRTEDGKFPVDASGTFPNGKTFVTPAEMKALLASELPEFAHCLTGKMLTYALGRGVERYDRRAVQDIERQLTASGYKFQTLITAIVHSVPFQQRRRELSSTKETASK